MDQLIRTGLVSLFDADFHGRSVDAESLTALTRAAIKPDYEQVFTQSLGWLFYDAKVPLFEIYFSIKNQRVATRTPSCLAVIRRRYLFSVADFSGHIDPLEAKKKAWEFKDISHKWLNGLGLHIEEVETHYPFVAVQVASTILEEYSKKHALSIGRLFTGGYEQEKEPNLGRYIERPTLDIESTNCYWSDGQKQWVYTAWWTK